MAFDTLLSPVTIGSVRIKNRLFLPPHGERLPPGRQLRYLEERVKNGLGLMICTQPAAAGTSAFTAGPGSVLPPSYLGADDILLPNPSTLEGADFFDRLLMPQMQRQAELAHRYGAACFAQLTHLGSYAIYNNWQAGLSPSGLADEMLGEPTHAMTVDEIADLVVAFGHGAARVQRCGMDGVEISACNGLLLNAFLSPLTNLRTDDYGGSLEGRAKLVLQILEEVRHRVGPDLVVGIRIPGDEMIAGGLTSADMIAVAGLVRPFVDYLSVGASSEPGRKSGLTVPVVMTAEFGPAVFAEAAQKIRAHTDLPVLLAGGIRDPEIAEQVLASGQADMVGAVRAQIADPAWFAKVRSGDLAAIRACTGDNEGCRTRTQFRTKGTGTSIGCTVNAAVGREEEMEIAPATVAKSVLIVGGGPAGMEAARVAALRGHRVLLCERADELGGQVLIAALDPTAARLIEAVSYLRRQMQSLDIDLRLNTVVSLETVDDFGADAIVIATGAVPLIPLVAGVDPASAITASDVLRGTAPLGLRVCVVGGLDGHRLPGAVAELLADRGHSVTVTTERMFLGENQDPAANHHSLKRLYDRGVRVEPVTGLAAVDRSGSVTVFNALTRKEKVLGQFDSIVFAAGGQARDELFRRLRSAQPKGTITAVGDCLAPRRIAHAVMEGYRAALTL